MRLLFSVLEISPIVQEIAILLHSVPHIIEALVITGCQKLRLVRLGKALILALQHLRELPVLNAPCAQCINHRLGHLIVGMGMAGTAVVDAAWPLILPEPEVDLYYILYIDKVTAMLTIAIFAITAKESAYSRILKM